MLYQRRSGVDNPQQLQSLTTAVPVTARCMCNVSVHTVTKWCRYSTTITEPNDSRTRHCTPYPSLHGVCAMCRYIQSRSGVDIPQQLQSLTTAVPVTARCMCNVSVHTVTKWCRYSTTITEPNDSRRHCTVYVQCRYIQSRSGVDIPQQLEPNDSRTRRCMCNPYPSLHGVCAMCRYIQSRSGVDIPQQLQSLTTAVPVTARCMCNVSVHTVTKWCRYSTTITEPNDSRTRHCTPYPSLHGVCAMCRYIQSRSGVDIPQQLQSLTTAVPVTARCMCNVSVHTVTKWCRYSTTITEPNDSRTRHCTVYVQCVGTYSHEVVSIFHNNYRANDSRTRHCTVYVQCVGTYSHEVVSIFHNNYRA
ncbi:hypothetical protein J6590_085835 [Homalodisca vitripennis]|nr:hypothetical protein J6590_085835 [Homalodisca vitripennis]